MTQQQRINGFQPRKSQKATDTTRQHLAAMAKLVVKPGRLIVVVTPQGTELYRGYDFRAAAEILTSHNHTLDERQTPV